jgi:hypothetical protein
MICQQVFSVAANFFLKTFEREHASSRKKGQLATQDGESIMSTAHTPTFSSLVVVR